MTFKIYAVYEPPKQIKLCKFVIVKRDADDSGYADRDITLQHLRDSLKFALKYGNETVRSSHLR